MQLEAGEEMSRKLHKHKYQLHNKMRVVNLNTEENKFPSHFKD